MLNGKENGSAAHLFAPIPEKHDAEKDESGVDFQHEFDNEKLRES